MHQRRRIHRPCLTGGLRAPRLHPHAGSQLAARFGQGGAYAHGLRRVRRAPADLGHPRLQVRTVNRQCVAVLHAFRLRHRQVQFQHELARVGQPQQRVGLVHPLPGQRHALEHRGRSGGTHHQAPGRCVAGRYAHDPEPGLRGTQHGVRLRNGGFRLAQTAFGDQPFVMQRAVAVAVAARQIGRCARLRQRGAGFRQIGTAQFGQRRTARDLLALGHRHAHHHAATGRRHHPFGIGRRDHPRRPGRSSRSVSLLRQRIADAEPLHLRRRKRDVGRMGRQSGEQGTERGQQDDAQFHGRIPRLWL